MGELFKNKYVVYALIFTILVITALLARKTVQKAIENGRENKFDKNDGVLTRGIDVNYFVQAYKNAINPSGISWLGATDGTDEDSIYNLAKKGRGHINDISKAYKSKFQESLLDALTSELDAEQLEQWRALAY